MWVYASFLFASGLLVCGFLLLFPPPAKKKNLVEKALEDFGQPNSIVSALKSSIILLHVHVSIMSKIQLMTMRFLGLIQKNEPRSACELFRDTCLYAIWGCFDYALIL